MFKGFYRSLTRQQRKAQSQEQDNQEQQQPPEGNPNHNTSGVKEGKDLMSVELYKKVCHWFLDWGTLDGVFAHCFLVLTWNLACHASNTTNIRLSEVEWDSTFDAFEIFFAHMKTAKRQSILGTCMPILTVQWFVQFLPLRCILHAVSILPSVGTTICFWETTNTSISQSSYAVSSRNTGMKSVFLGPIHLRSAHIRFGKAP